MFLIIVFENTKNIILGLSENFSYYLNLMCFFVFFVFFKTKKNYETKYIICFLYFQEQKIIFKNSKQLVPKWYFLCFQKLFSRTVFKIGTKQAQSNLLNRSIVQKIR